MCEVIAASGASRFFGSSPCWLVPQKVAGVFRADDVGYRQFLVNSRYSLNRAKGKQQKRNRGPWDISEVCV